jgi:hypothetical protein
MLLAYKNERYNGKPASHHGRIRGKDDGQDGCWLAEMKALRKEMMAQQEVIDACLESKEPTSLGVEFEAEHEQVPQEKAAVETFRALKKQHGDWHLAVRHCGQPKKWTQGNGGSWKKFATKDG